MSRESSVSSTQSPFLVLVDMDALIILQEKETDNDGLIVDCVLNKDIHEFVEKIRGIFRENNLSLENLQFVLFTKEQKIEERTFIKSVAYESGQYQELINIGSFYIAVQKAFSNIFYSDILRCKENADGTINLDIDAIAKKFAIVDLKQILIIGKDIHLSAQQQNRNCRVVTCFSAGKIDATDLAKFYECVNQDFKAAADSKTLAVVDSKQEPTQCTVFIDVDDTLLIRPLIHLSSTTTVNDGLLETLEEIQQKKPRVSFELLTARPDFSLRDREMLKEFSEFKQAAGAQKKQKKLSDACQQALQEMQSTVKSTLLAAAKQTKDKELLQMALAQELDTINKKWAELLSKAESDIDSMQRKVEDWKFYYPFSSQAILKTVKRKKPHLDIKESAQSYVHSEKTKKNKSIAIEERINQGLEGIIVLFDNSEGELFFLRKRFPTFSAKVSVLGVRVYEDGNFTNADITVMHNFAQEMVQVAIVAKEHADQSAFATHKLAADADLEELQELPLLQAMRQLTAAVDAPPVVNTFTDSVECDHPITKVTRVATPFDDLFELALPPQVKAAIDGQSNTEDDADSVIFHRAARQPHGQQTDEGARATTYSEYCLAAPSIDNTVTPRAVPVAGVQPVIPELVLNESRGDEKNDDKKKPSSFIGVSLFHRATEIPASTKPATGVGVSAAAAAAVAIVSLGSTG